MVEPESGGTPQVLATPTVTFKSLAFSDGTTVSLSDTDIIVLVGPNNAGKSVALRELRQHMGAPEAPTVVVSHASLRQTGTSAEFVEYFRKHVNEIVSGDSTQYLGYNLNFGLSHLSLETLWEGNFSTFAPFFCQLLETETRISASNPVPPGPFLTQPPSHPIHMIYLDEILERKINTFFRKAFDLDLVVYHLGGSEIPLLVGDAPPLFAGEGRTTKAYAERLFDSTVPLQDQGDGMRSFASVVLHALAPTTPTVLLLDEPEAFLHPPQARLLGKILATERATQGQLFVATHSPDVLSGLMEGAPDKLRIFRMQRDGDVNRVDELDKAFVSKIMSDPLMKHSGALSGLFHERVIVCESDADCMFYSTVLDLPAVHGGHLPDVLFTHASGTGRMADLAEAFRAAGVEVDVLADMDILGEEGNIKKLIEALGGEWEEVRGAVREIKRAVEGEHRPATVKETLGELQSIVASAEQHENSASLRRSVMDVFAKSSTWAQVKRAGEQAIPRGQPTERYRNLRSRCADLGLWFVPVGELEAFCKGVGGKGPGWVQTVLEERSIADDSELAEARKFMGDVWHHRH